MNEGEPSAPDRDESLVSGVPEIDAATGAHDSRPPGLPARALLGLMFWSVVATACLAPFSYRLIRQFDPPIAEPEWLMVIMGVSACFEIVISGFAILIGSAAGRAVGMTRIFVRPEIEEIESKRTRYWHAYGEPFVFGLAMAGVLALFTLGDNAGAPNAKAAVSIPPAWQGLLASFGAGVREEIWFRFGLMTLLIWLVAKMSRQTVEEPPAVSAWNVRLSNSIAAIAFSMVHLPQAGGLIGLDTPVVLFVMLGNGLPGLVFGWLFWTRGLCAAALAHFSFDVVLKFAIPLLFGR